MHSEVLKHPESYVLCCWKIINRKKDMDHSLTGFKISEFKLKQAAILALTTITFTCLDEYANVELNILVVKK